MAAGKGKRSFAPLGFVALCLRRVMPPARLCGIHQHDKRTRQGYGRSDGGKT